MSTPPTLASANRYPRRTVDMAVLLLTLLAFALRLYQLDAQSLWYDEGVTAEIAQRSFAAITRWTARDIQPPLYYFVVSAWGKLLGMLGPHGAAWSEWSLRFPSAAFGTVTVPLLAALAGRLTGDRRAAVLAALLTALHPLLLYYSQEARMYAMLTALGVLAGYLVVRGLARGTRDRRIGIAYVLVATAAVYTHYFAFFLLLGVGVAALLEGIMRQRLGPVLRSLVAANLAVLLLYLPWFVPLFIQLNADTSYWQGSLKFAEALRSVAIRFSGGETVIEAQALWLLVPGAIVTLAATIGLIVAARRARTAGRVLIYALCWLLIPIGGVLALAAFVPKFNPRYVMMALPGLLLLWSGGLIALLGAAGRTGTALCVGLTAALLAMFIYADRNWFVDPAFTKAQWRELTSYVRQHKSDDEGVVLVSGHAWPIWNYYAADLPAARVPPLEILDVNAVVDYAQSARLLRAALADQTGAWYVGWQDDVVDPMGVTPLHLELSGQATPVDEEFWHLDLHHYTNLDTEAIRGEVPLLAGGPVNFGNQLQLLGYSQLPDDELVLFWQLHPAHAASPVDYRMTGQLWTAEGLPYATLSDRRPAGFNHPAFRWQPGQIAISRIPASDWAGPDAAPGAYSLRLGIYDPAGDPAGLDVLGEQGEPAGKTATLPLTLSQPTASADGVDAASAVPLSTALAVTATLGSDRAEPGQPVQLELTWFVDETPPRAYDLQLAWMSADGTVAAREEMPLQPASPSDQWPPDTSLRTVHRVRPPLALTPGTYTLGIALSPSEGDQLDLPFTVLPSTRAFTPPELAQRVDASFGEQIALLGLVEPLPQAITAGETITVMLAWQALTPIDADYAVTVQLLDASGTPQAQADAALPGGSASWLPDQVETQSFALAAPETPGAYPLLIAVYDPQQAGLPRLFTANGADALMPATIEISPRAE